MRNTDHLFPGSPRGIWNTYSKRPSAYTLTLALESDKAFELPS